MSSPRLFFVLSLLFLDIAAEFSIDDAALFKIQFNVKEKQPHRKVKESLSDADAELFRHAAEAGGDDLRPPSVLNVEKPPNEDLTPTFDPPVGGTLEQEDKSSEGEGEILSPRRTVVMTSSDNERYTCTLPEIRADRRSSDHTYDGPNVMELLQQLFVTQACTYRMEHYWTYELCHGRYLRQYHEERDGKEIKVIEYFLGKYNSDLFKEDLAAMREQQASQGSLPKPKKKKIETLNMPFFSLNMGDGTICDLNDRPRHTTVNYVCYPSGKNEMYSFKESSTCEYDVIILSPLLCKHPDYRPEESNEHVIDCRPLDDRTPQKPKSLVKLENESVMLRTHNKAFEGEFMQGNTPGSVRIEIKPVVATLDDAGVEAAVDDLNKPENWPSSASSTRREPFKPLMDPEIVREFLLGEYCLYGGSGWWKYEFCFGKRVNQYHEERNGKKTVINLGYFDVAAHLKWVEQNPIKGVPKPLEHRKYVSHYYSGGDVCDVTNKPRNVEVKLKCKKSDSPSVVSLYLMEPKTCEYILGVESPLVCDILHLADSQTGLIDLSREVFKAGKEEAQAGHPLSSETSSEEDRAAQAVLEEAERLKEAISGIMSKESIKQFLEENEDLDLDSILYDDDEEDDDISKTEDKED